MSQEDIEDELTEQEINVEKFPTPLEFLLSNCYRSPEYNEYTKLAFEFFIHEPVNFLFEHKAILIGDINKIAENIQDENNFRIINEDNFLKFQNMIRQSIGADEEVAPDPNEDERAKKMKAKARYRDRVKAKNQAKKNKNSLANFLASICCMNVGVTPLNIGEITYVAALELVERYQLKEKYELDIQTILAGGNSKGNKIKPVYWIGNNE